MYRYKKIWNILISMCYLVAFFFDPYLFGFWFEPLVDANAARFQVFLCFIFLADSFMTPFTGILKKVLPAEESEDEEV